MPLFRPQSAETCIDNTTIFTRLRVKFDRRFDPLLNMPISHAQLPKALWVRITTADDRRSLGQRGQRPVTLQLGGKLSALDLQILHAVLVSRAGE